MSKGKKPPGDDNIKDLESARAAREAAAVAKAVIEIARLSMLDPISYDRRREEAAKALGVRAATLDSEVSKIRAGGGRGDGVVLALRDRETVADMLIELAVTAGAAFWADQDHNAYVTVPVDGHVENHPLRGGAFRRWLLRRYAATSRRALRDGQQVPGAIGPDHVAAAVQTFEAMATEGPPVTPWVRTAFNDDRSRVYLDIGGPDWSAIEVSADRWQVIAQPPVRFIRPPGLRALPQPVPAGSVHDLRELVNLPEADQFILFVSCMVAALWPAGPYPVLLVLGEGGSAKTTLSRFFRRLTDPNRAELRSPPKDDTDLVHAATNARVVAIENVSRIPVELSDTICRIATGAGLSRRKLYTDGEEYQAYVCNPVILNGIDIGPLRGDLVSRAVTLNLPPLPAGHDRSSRIEAAFGAVAGSVFGGLLDGLASALRNQAVIAEQDHFLPRMADFAVLAMAAAEPFGWTPDQVLEALLDNARHAVRDVLDGDPVARVLTEWASQGEGAWKGTASQLLDRLYDLLPPARDAKAGSEARAIPPGWPADAARLSGRLTRLAPELRKAGIDVSQARTPDKERKKLISLTFRKTASGASGASEHE